MGVLSLRWGPFKPSWWGHPTRSEPGPDTAPHRHGQPNAPNTGNQSSAQAPSPATGTAGMPLKITPCIKRYARLWTSITTLVAQALSSHALLKSTSEHAGQRISMCGSTHAIRLLVDLP